MMPGARIEALAEGSYIAMIAPGIIQQGNVRVNGSAGYIAAEAVDLVINDGLFDINVQTGSEVANAIRHRGSTGGPASGALGDNHNIYMVAMPKNQAITVLLEGNVGFDAATDVIFVRNDVEAGGKPYRIIVAREGQAVPAGAEVVRSKHDRGIALVRLLLKDPAEIGGLDAARRRSSCRSRAATTRSASSTPRPT